MWTLNWHTGSFSGKPNSEYNLFTAVVFKTKYFVVFYASDDTAPILPSFSLNVNSYIIIGEFYSQFKNWPGVKVVFAFKNFPPQMKYKICKEESGNLLGQFNAAFVHIAYRI